MGIFGNNRKPNKVLAGFFAVFMLTVALSVCVFTAVETFHDCSGEDCPVCITLMQCESLLRGPGSLTDTQPQVLFYLCAILPVLSVSFAFIWDTPVTRKVRLND
ncbi:MAG: hypothetical protein ILP13_10355 [Lachnospiraceae bacterium]|nr:hypothetical protein [Lachnospiraceae bacterium]